MSSRIAGIGSSEVKNVEQKIKELDTHATPLIRAVDRLARGGFMISPEDLRLQLQSVRIVESIGGSQDSPV